MPATATLATASLWIYFRSPLGDELVKATDRRRLKYCKLCPQKGKVWATSVPTNAKTHLLAKHSITLDTSISNSSRATSQLSIYDAFQATPRTPVFDKARYTRAMALLTTRRRIPFSACEWPEWQELCVSLNEPVVDQLIKSRRTMGRRINVAYDVFRAQ
jgi:hypothetical protein